MIAGMTGIYSARFQGRLLDLSVTGRIARPSTMAQDPRLSTVLMQDRVRGSALRDRNCNRQMVRRSHRGAFSLLAQTSAASPPRGHPAGARLILRPSAAE